MKFIQTKKQQLLAPKPTKLEMLREINNRNGLEQHKPYKDLLYRLEKGQQGEERLINYLKKFGSPQWTALRNIWFEYYGEFECDLLLLTNTGPVAFEVKNYSGPLELQNNQCLQNGQPIGSNPFTQAQKVMLNLKKICQTENVQGVLAFVGEHNHITTHEPIAGIEVRMQNQLRHYIRKLAYQDRKQSFDTASFLQTLDPFEIGAPTKEKDLPGEIKTLARRGIHCCRCNNFDLDTNKNYIICPCGMHEPREEAIVRTMCEYGLIYPDRELTTKALAEFVDGEVSESTVFRHLTKHFKRIGKHKNSEYRNPRAALENNKQAFKLTEPKYIRLN